MRSVLSVTAVVCLLFATPRSGWSQKTYFQFGFGPSIPTGLTNQYRNLGGHFEDEVSISVSENFRLGFENSFNFLGLDRHAYPGTEVTGGGQWLFFLGGVGRVQVASRSGLFVNPFVSTGLARIMQNGAKFTVFDMYGRPHKTTTISVSSESWYYSIGATVGYKVLYLQARYLHTDYDRKVLTMIPITVGIRVR
jgi:hypothetical protein